MEIYCLEYGRTYLTERFLFPQGDREKKVPITLVFYLVKWQGQNILIDAGCDTLPGFQLTCKRTPAEALGDAGLTPEQIHRVIITHAHQDHIEGVRYFPRATVHIQEEEYRRGSRFIPSQMQVETFRDRTRVGPLEVICIGGHTPGSCIVKGGGYLFVGDECYSLENFSEGIPTGSTCNIEKSRDFVEQYGKSDLTKLMFHDLRTRIGKIL